MDLIDWLDGKRVIRQQPPTQSTQHRLFIIDQLKPIMRELETLELSALTISEAMAHYQNHYQKKAQARRAMLPHEIQRLLSP